MGRWKEKGGQQRGKKQQSENESENNSVSSVSGEESDTDSTVSGEASDSEEEKLVEELKRSTVGPVIENEPLHNFLISS